MRHAISMRIAAWSVALVLLLTLALPAHATTTIVVPPPEPGSFFTVFDYTHDGRIVAFDGFTVFIQQDRHSSQFTVLGTLPEEFRGATDPTFIVVSPNGRWLILGGGAGGSQYPDPQFNGTLFRMPRQGGEATLIGTFPFAILGVFRNNHQFFFGQGETFGTFTGSIEVLNLRSGEKRSVIGNIPGDPGGITFDWWGNLFVGLGAGQDSTRTGEIRRFDRRAIREALRNGTVLDFDADSTLVAQTLNAGDLEFDAQGDLFVGGGQFTGAETGFIAQVDVATGEIVDRFDPTDGDPNDGDITFFSLAITPGGCRLGALDLNSFFNESESIIYEQQVCSH